MNINKESAKHTLINQVKDKNSAFKYIMCETDISKREPGRNTVKERVFNFEKIDACMVVSSTSESVSFASGGISFIAPVTESSNESYQVRFIDKEDLKEITSLGDAIDITDVDFLEFQEEFVSIENNIITMCLRNFNLEITDEYEFVKTASSKFSRILLFDLDNLKFINTSDALLQMKEWDRKRRNSGTVYMDALYNERTYVYWDLDNSLINEFIAKLSAISIKKKYEECILSSLLSAYSGYSRMYGLAEALIYISNWSQLLDD